MSVRAGNLHQRTVQASGKLAHANAPAGKAVGHRVAEQIVHRRVKAVRAEQPRGVAPRLTQQHGLRELALDFLSPPDNGMAIQLVRHVKAPAVDARLPQPVEQHVAHIGSHLAVGAVEPRHVGIIPHALIAGRVDFDGKPLGIKPAPVAAFLSVFQQILKRGKVNARMVEYAVQNHADARLVAPGDQLAQRVLCAEHRIDRKVICRRVFMVEISRKDGIQIQAFHA